MSLPQQTNPPTLYQASVEDITYGIDCTALLVGSQTLTAATAALTGPAGAVTLVDGPAVVGNVVQQRVRADVLTGTTLYQLLVTVTPSGTTNVLAEILAINCPF
jgi:hypothetical protein